MTLCPFLDIAVRSPKRGREPQIYRFLLLKICAVLSDFLALILEEIINLLIQLVLTHTVDGLDHFVIQLFNIFRSTCDDLHYLYFVVLLNAGEDLDLFAVSRVRLCAAVEGQILIIFGSDLQAADLSVRYTKSLCQCVYILVSEQPIGLRTIYALLHIIFRARNFRIQFRNALIVVVPGLSFDTILQNQLGVFLQQIVQQLPGYWPLLVIIVTISAPTPPLMLSAP